MRDRLKNSYERIPLDLLAKFYFEINGNMEKGLLSRAMEMEANLIKKTLLKRGVLLLDKNRNTV